jgi:hypothetical protein
MNTPRVRYQEIVEKTSAQLQDQVLNVMKKHVGKENKISRVNLISEVFHISLSAGRLSNSAQDRQIRRVVAELQQNYPVLASSGDGGYYMASSMDEINEYIAEIESRARKLFDKSRQIKSMAEKFAVSRQMRLNL